MPTYRTATSLSWCHGVLVVGLLEVWRGGTSYSSTGSHCSMSFPFRQGRLSACFMCADWRCPKYGLRSLPRQTSSSNFQNSYLGFLQHAMSSPAGLPARMMRIIHNVCLPIESRRCSYPAALYNQRYSFRELSLLATYSRLPYPAILGDRLSSRRSHNVFSPRC